jgi:integrase
VVARDHPHAVRAKSGYRRLYVSDELDRLYGEYVWQLCESGADLGAGDFDATCVFVNLDREPRFAPWRPESVYDLVDRLRRQLSGQVPAAWTPHWMRHSHATALLLSGVPVHVVSRRLGHADVQTTLNTYAHVSEDVEMRAVAQWKALAAGWRIAMPADDKNGSWS